MGGGDFTDLAWASDFALESLLLLTFTASIVAALVVEPILFACCRAKAEVADGSELPLASGETTSSASSPRPAAFFEASFAAIGDDSKGTESS